MTSCPRLSLFISSQTWNQPSCQEGLIGRTFQQNPNLDLGMLIAAGLVISSRSFVGFLGGGVLLFVLFFGSKSFQWIELEKKKPSIHLFIYQSTYLSDFIPLIHNQDEKILLKFLNLTIISLLLPQIPFFSDTNMMIHLLYPISCLWQYQNNNTSTSTNHMITENNLRFLCAALFVLRVYSLGTHRLPYLKVTWRSPSLFMLQAQYTVLFCFVLFSTFTDCFLKFCLNNQFHNDVKHLHGSKVKSTKQDIFNEASFHLCHLHTSSPPPKSSHF